MMIPEYVRYYGGSVESVLSTYARTFFAMLNSMYSLKAKELLDDLYMTSNAFAGKEAQSYEDALKKQAKGISGIVSEVRTVKQ